MSKAELKTKQNKASVSKFIASVKDERMRKDCETLTEIMRKATKCEPQMWGPSIVGFDTYHYTYASGREGDWMVTGFSPRKQNLSIYIMPGFNGFKDLMGKLGKHKTGKSCLYVKSLDDVHLPTLRKLVRESVKRMKKGAAYCG